MHPRNNPVSPILLVIIFLLVPFALWAQGAAPAKSAPQPAQAQPAGQPPAQGTTLDEALRPEELVVPSNAATEAAEPVAAAPPEAAPPNVTPTTTRPQQPGNATQVPGNTGEVRQSGKGFSLVKNVEEVVLHATVVDERQRLVTNLDRGAFTVLEDGQPREISSFRHEDVPVAIGILVDNSGSMREKRSAVNTAALNFVQASNPQDQVFIVNFDSDAYLDVDFTSSIPKLREALERIEAKGGTALYDAVSAGADHLGKKAKLEKRVLLVITDGWDNSSSLSLEQAVQAVQTENGPTIYTIGILDEEGKKKGRRALKELAEQTGGVAFFPRDLAEVDSITKAVAHDIRNQYIIGYKKDPSKSADAGYRTVKVLARANGYKNLQVRTRSGYFPGQETAQTK